MGKRQRDCVACGGPVGIIGRQHCSRCWSRLKDTATKATCPGCSKERVLQDDTGRCVISPDGAEVLTNEGRTWIQNDRRYNEWMLMPGAVLYAIGEFRTGTAIVSAAADENTETGTLLAEWKQDQAKLLERFDLNKDGKIDMKEWELARLQARREVRKKLGDTDARPIEGMHLLRKPADGRLFLLANEVPDKLGARYRFWSWVHLGIFIGLGSLGLVLL